MREKAISLLSTIALVMSLFFGLSITVSAYELLRTDGSIWEHSAADNNAYPYLSAADNYMLKEDVYPQDVIESQLCFADVADTAWYYDAVTFCAARGITTGTGGGNFSPEATLTRGQLLVMLMRAYGIEPDENPTDNFSDAGDTYYTDFLAAAKRVGITTGIGNNLFAPEAGIRRQELFTLIYRTLSLLDSLPKEASGSGLANYTDADNIASYAAEAMDTLVKTHIVNGIDGKLYPLETSTRAQMVQVLYNLLSM